MAVTRRRSLRSIRARHVIRKPRPRIHPATNRASAAISRTTSSPEVKPHASAATARRSRWPRRRRPLTPSAPAATCRIHPGTRPRRALGVMPTSMWLMEKRERAFRATNPTRTTRVKSRRPARAVMRRSPESTRVPTREGSLAKRVTSRTPLLRSMKRRSVFPATPGRRPSWRRTRDTRPAPRVMERPSHTRPQRRPRAGPATPRSRRARLRAISVVRSATIRTRASPRRRAPHATRARRPESTRPSRAGARHAIVHTAPRESPRPRRARAATRRRRFRLSMPSPATRSVPAVTSRPTSPRTQTASRARERATPTNETISRAPRYAPDATCSGVR